MLTAFVGLAAGLAVSVGAWVSLGTLALFLFLPFVPFLLAGRGDDRDRRRARTCPECGFRTTDPEYEYCPRDRTVLRETE